MWWSCKNWFWTVSTFRGSGGLERTECQQFLLSEGLVVMKELVFNHFYFRRLWWSWKNSFWTVSAFRGCGGLERTYFEQSLLSEGAVVECGGVVVLNELILNSFYFQRVWWSWKNWFWTVSTFRGCDGLERTNFEQFYFHRCSSREWWSWKNWFWTVSTLGGSGGHERTDFEHFLLSEGEVVLKELILNSFYFQRVWWSWKNWF